MATRTAPKNNDKALSAYVAAQTQIAALLAQITKEVHDHQDSLDPEDVHWGHVGDVQRIVAQLKDIVSE